MKPLLLAVAVFTLIPLIAQAHVSAFEQPTSQTEHTLPLPPEEPTIPENNMPYATIPVVPSISKDDDSCDDNPHNDQYNKINPFIPASRNHAK